MTLNLCCALNSTSECILCGAKFCDICETDKNHPIHAYLAARTMNRGRTVKVQVTCKSTSCKTVIVPIVR